MEKAIIGKKVGMSQIFDTDGKVIPVTVIEAGPCVVVQKKTAEKDGYEAVQLGFEDVPERKLTKPEKGHLAKAGVSPKKHLKEFQLKKAAEMNVGDIVKADTFAVGDHVDVTGVSKGKGYAGVIKRFGARSLKASHGTGPVAKHPGSMGSGTDPSRVWKGKIEAGHMGVDQVTIMNLDVVKVDPEVNMLVVCGAVPGPCQPAEGLRETLRERRELNNDESFEHGRHPGRRSGAELLHLWHRAQYGRCA